MKWRLFICTDCDTDDGAVIMQVPDGAAYDHSCPIAVCLGCGSYGGMTGMGDVEVTGSSLYHLRIREPA